MESETIRNKFCITFFDLKTPSFVKSNSILISDPSEIDHIELKLKIKIPNLKIMHENETKLIHIENTFNYSCQEFLLGGLDLNECQKYELEFNFKIIEKNPQKKSKVKILNNLIILN